MRKQNLFKADGYGFGRIGLKGFGGLKAKKRSEFECLQLKEIASGMKSSAKIIRVAVDANVVDGVGHYLSWRVPVLLCGR